MMKISKLLLALIVAVNSLKCQEAKPNKEMIQTNPNSLLAQLSKKERDPDMMFYINKAYEGNTVIEVLENSGKVMEDFITAIPEEKMGYTYQFGKWTVAEVLQHIISYEYIMTESTLKIANKPIDKPIGYYNQTTTAEAGKGASKQEMLERLKKARKTTIETLATFSEGELKEMGIHEWFAASPRSLVLCISGHQAHHFDILATHYLN